MKPKPQAAENGQPNTNVLLTVKGLVDFLSANIVTMDEKKRQLVNIPKNETTIKISELVELPRRRLENVNPVKRSRIVSNYKVSVIIHCLHKQCIIYYLNIVFFLYKWVFFQ